MPTSPAHRQNPPDLPLLPAPPGPRDPVAHLARKVAHELNSPLDGVMRFVALAQRKIRDKNYDDIERYLADAEFGLQRMAEILRELTDVPSAATSSTSRRLPIDILLDQAARTHAPAAEARHIAICIQPIAAPTPHVDPHLYQVVSNLLKNAIEAMPQGGTATFIVEVSPAATPPTLTLRLFDTGPGIAPHAQQRLFEPFFTTKPPREGMGLGLAVCRDIVTKLGGSITLRNRPHGEGCEAIVTLPL